MALLTNNDIRAAAYLGLIGIDGLTDLNATSLDIRIEQLLTPAMDRKDMKPVPLIDGEYWLIKPGQHFLYETVESFLLAPGFHGKIHSRSSWARHGVASREAHDEFADITNEFFDSKVICRINTLGTTVKIRPGDTLAQAHLGYRGIHPTTDEVLEQMIKEGHLEITRRGKPIKRLLQTFMFDGQPVVGHKINGGRKMNNGFTLTHDPLIRIYKGGIIDPHNPDPDNFYEKRLANRGTTIAHGSFFLSSSAEVVKIDRHFAGWVHEWNHLLVTSGYHGPTIHPDERPSSLQTHAAAPKIDPYPRFTGKITFENLAYGDVNIRPGQRLADFLLFPLNNPYVPDKDEKSRYKGQSEATSSRSHLDYQK